jgi:calcium-dependent protein kinase
VSTSKFKQASLQFIASQMTQKEIGNLAEIFNALDKDEDGELSFEEFQSAITSLNSQTAADLQEVFNKIDTNKNGSINYTEFIAATMSQKMYLKEEKIYEAFKLFDKNGDGYITADEIKEVLGCKISIFTKFDHFYNASKFNFG